MSWFTFLLLRLRSCWRSSTVRESKWKRLNNVSELSRYCHYSKMGLIKCSAFTIYYFMYWIRETPSVLLMLSVGPKQTEEEVTVSMRQKLSLAWLQEGHVKSWWPFVLGCSYWVWLFFHLNQWVQVRPLGTQALPLEPTLKIPGQERMLLIGVEKGMV